MYYRNDTHNNKDCNTGNAYDDDNHDTIPQFKPMMACLRITRWTLHCSWGKHIENKYVQIELITGIVIYSATQTFTVMAFLGFFINLTTRLLQQGAVLSIESYKTLR